MGKNIVIVILVVLLGVAAIFAFIEGRRTLAADELNSSLRAQLAERDTAIVRLQNAKKRFYLFESLGDRFYSRYTPDVAAVDIASVKKAFPHIRIDEWQTPLACFHISKNADSIYYSQILANTDDHSPFLKVVEWRASYLRHVRNGAFK